jgi:hypothetical protein
MKGTSMTIYLYKKTHNITGLKYLGKTTRDPYKYKGSGYDWIPHIRKHGYDVTTEIIKECESNDELSYWGRYYSKLWNIVDAMDDFGNKVWANRIPETGNGCVLLGENNPATTDIVKKKFSGGNHYMKKDNYVPSKNPRYDQTMYQFENINTGEKVTCSQYELRTTHKLEAGNLSRVIKGKQSSIHGWKLNK